MKTLIFAAVIFFCAQLKLFGGEIVKSEVKKDGEIYSAEIEARINVKRELAWNLFKDYGNFKNLNHYVLESTVIERYNDDNFKGRMAINVCFKILFWKKCMVVTQTEIVSQNGKEIISETVPGESSFKKGKIYWLITEDGSGKTLIKYRIEAEPNFYIPPLLGTRLIKKKIVDIATETIGNVEKMAVINKPANYPFENK